MDLSIHLSATLTFWSILTLKTAGFNTRCWWWALNILAHKNRDINAIHTYLYLFINLLIWNVRGSIQYLFCSRHWSLIHVQWRITITKMKTCQKWESICKPVLYERKIKIISDNKNNWRWPPQKQTVSMNTWTDYGWKWSSRFVPFVLCTNCVLKHKSIW